MDFLHEFFSPLLDAAAANRPMLLVLMTSAIGSGFGAWFGARAIITAGERRARRDIQGVANVSIAAFVALLGKLINFKRDLVAPAQAAATALDNMMQSPDPEKGHVGINLELWPELPFELRLSHEKLFAQAGEELDVVQLVKMLDYNLAELSHLVRQRNALIRQMNEHQAAKGALPADGVKLYLRYAAELSRNVDENLFFLDRAIVKVREAAMKLLPDSLRRGVADVGLKPEAAPLMPPKDLIKSMAK
ncbi:MAG: hypothetical protein EPN97_06210 [Alphaproteobacteria bacterium]|nr:MAG: hypothetical protein EPN97_06210 [Alphaproteobacteria bacterium]